MTSSKSPQGPRHLPARPGVTIVLFQDGKCSSIHYTQCPLTMGRVAKVVTLLCFKEGSQKPRSTGQFQLYFIDLNSLPSQT